MFLEISQNSQENTCVRVSIFIKLLWDRWFPVNFEKFLRRPFYRTPLDDCFWCFCGSSSNILYDFLRNLSDFPWCALCTCFQNNKFNQFNDKSKLDKVILKKKYVKIFHLFLAITLQKFVVFVLIMTPADTGRKLNVHSTFRRRPRRFLKVLCRFNLRPVSIGTQISGRWQKADLPDSDPG